MSTLGQEILGHLKCQYRVIISPYSIKLRKLFRWEDTRCLLQFEQILWKDALLSLSTNQLGIQGYLRYSELSLGSWPLSTNPDEHPRRIYPILQHFADLSDTLEYLRIPRKAQASSVWVIWSHIFSLTIVAAYKRAHTHTHRVNLQWEMLILNCILLQVPVQGATLSYLVGSQALWNCDSTKAHELP